jgi:hypothetical protein
MMIGMKTLKYLPMFSEHEIPHLDFHMKKAFTYVLPDANTPLLLNGCRRFSVYELYSWILQLFSWYGTC